MPDPTFINYYQPSDQTDRQNRRLVASYIGTHYRNRSRPSARKTGKENEAPLKNSPGGMTLKDERPQNQRALSRSRSRRSSPAASQASLVSLQPVSIAHDTHGYRSDPFNTYPIEFRECIPAAVDYFLQFYGPTHIIRPEILSEETGAAVLRQYFRYALQDSLMFEALIALAQTNLTIHRWVEGPDKDALLHYSRSLQRLREVLSQKDGYTRDSTLFAIMALMGVDLLTNDLAAFEMHLGGLRQIVALRGGVDQLGWPTVLKPSLIGYRHPGHEQNVMILTDFERMESFWAYMAKNNSNEHQQPITPPNYLDLQHPYHRSPISGIDELIAPLPAGFRDLVLNYRLSLPVITLVNRVITKGRYIDQVESCPGGSPSWAPNAANMQEAEYAVRLLACTNLTLIERSVCIGMLISILGRTRTERFSALYIQHLQHHAEELRQWREIFEASDLAHFYLWAAFEIAGTMMPPKIPVLSSDYQDDKRFKLLMVVMHKFGHFSWDEALDTLNKFISGPQCVESWHNSWELGMKHIHEL